MSDDRFHSWREKFLRDSNLTPLALGCSREQVLAAFGAPDRVSVVTALCQPLILKYEDFEFHFDAESGRRLSLIYAEDDTGHVRVALRAP